MSHRALNQETLEALEHVCSVAVKKAFKASSHQVWEMSLIAVASHGVPVSYVIQAVNQCSGISEFHQAIATLKKIGDSDAKNQHRR